MKRRTERVPSSCWEQLRTGKVWQRLSLALLVAVMTLTAQTARAGDGDVIYVSETGDDVNDGQTEDTPLKTISWAVSVAAGGETIYILNGEYSEDNTIALTKSLSFEGQSQDGVKITGTTSSLFSTTATELTLSFTNLTILDAGSGNYPAFRFLGSENSVTITNCTFDNCGSRYGTMQLGHSGTATIDGCTFLNSKATANGGTGAIYISAAGTYTIENAIIDDVQYTYGNGYMNGAIFVNNTSATLNIENTTITNVNAPSNGVICTKGAVNMTGCEIKGNTIGSASYSCIINVYNNGSATIEQTIITDNTCENELFYNRGSDAQLTVNYCNIHDNTASGIVNDMGSIDLEANYWGSNELPEGITATTWVVEDNGEYKLNNGDPLEKEIPGLNSAAEPDIYVSPNGDGDGSTKDAPTTLQNALENAPEGGSIFLCNGEYDIEQLFISKSVNLVGESRDGVKLTGDNGGFFIGDPVDPTNTGYSVGSVSFSKMTIESSSRDFILVPASMTDLTITDCVLSLTGRFLSVGYDVSNDNIVDATGTLNFNKNVVEGDDAIIAVGGQWDANINDNIFLNSNSGEFAVNNEEGVGTVNVDYNYWGSNDPATTLDYNDYIIATASSDATEIFTDESAEITVAMTLDDGTTNAKDYLPDYTIEATLSADGTLSQNTLTLVDGAGSVSYSSDVARNDNIQIAILGQTLTVPIEVKERYLGTIYVATTGSDDNEGSVNAPVATVGKAIELALVDGGSGEIIINAGTYVGNGYHVTGDLTVTGNVTGNDVVTLDANNEGRLFYMDYGDTANKIELHNLTLTKAIGYGAAVYSLANELVLDKVTIDDNEASGYLINSKGNLTVQNSSITNSKAGDVIHQSANGEILLIQNSVFKDNIATNTSDIAVINLGTAAGNLVIEDSKFINNTARQGVIKGNYNYNIEVTGTEFSDNTNTVSYGGAIYTSAGTLDITDCVFANNKAARSGGAIYVGYRSTATIVKSIFVDNTANTMNDEYYGDAIYDGNKLTVSNSVLLTNSNNYLIYSDGEDNIPLAQNCWWGTNDDPSSLNGAGTYEDDWGDEHDCPAVDVSNWATMDASFAPDDAQAGDEVTVTATFTNDELPDGIEVEFTSTSGNLNTVVLTEDAQASTTYTIDETDAAITATSGSAVVEMPIVDPFATNIVTQDNFYDFFDEYGNLLDVVPFDELIFQGEFSNLVPYITLDRAITITGDTDADTGDKNSVLNDMGFIIADSEVTLDNLTLVANSDLGNLIDIAGENVVISNNDITYVVSDPANAINVYSGANGVQILNNTINFTSTVDHYTLDDVTNAICVNSGDDPVTGLVINGNEITAVIPALRIDYNEIEYNVIGLSAVNGVRINGAEDFEFTNNILDVTPNRLDDYGTLQAMYVASSSGLMDGNDISMIDTFTPDGEVIYLYAVNLVNDNDLDISNNNFNISTDGGTEEFGTACAIESIASEFNVVDNNINIVSKGPNYGIYFPSMMGDPCDAEIRGNFIKVTGLATADNQWSFVSGIEIETGDVEISGNTIYTHNIGEYAEGNYIYGISYAQTVYGDGPVVEITDNTIITEGDYAISFPEVDDAVITGNNLCAHELTGDDAVSIADGSGNTVKNNLFGYVIMPKTDEITFNIPTNVSSFKVYDDGGQNGIYSPGCAGTLTLTAPDGYRLQLSGNIKTEKDNDYLTVYDGSSNQANVLINKVSSSVSSTETDIPTVISTGRSMTLYFCSDNSESGNSEFDGLDLTVTLIYNLNETDGFTAAIASEVAGKPVLFTRSGLTAGAYSTVCLPFAFEAPEGCTFYTFVGVTQDGSGKWIADVTEAGTSLLANTPYIFTSASATSVDFTNESVVSAESYSDADAYTTVTDWTFQGTYSRINLPKEGEHAYGFTSTAGKSVQNNDLEAGTFVYLVSGAWAAPFRAYLKYTGSDAAWQKGRTRSGAAALPSRITVRIVGGKGTATEIGTLRLESEDGEWYSLDGRRLVGKPATRGIYIKDGKKVVVK